MSWKAKSCSQSRHLFSKRDVKWEKKGNKVSRWPYIFINLDSKLDWTTLTFKHLKKGG